MAATTASDLIKRALVKAKVIGAVITPTAEQQNNAYDDLNDMLESWALEGLMVTADVLESFTLTISTNEYTWASGGDFDSARPVRVKESDDDWFIREGTIDYPVRVRPLSTFRSQGLKSTESRPELAAVNMEFPSAKVFLFPTPDAAYTLHVRSQKTLTGFSDLTTSVTLEPGYRRALWSNLALEILSGYGKTASRELTMVARESKANIKRNNTHVPQTKTPDLSRIARGWGGSSIVQGPYA